MREKLKTLSLMQLREIAKSNGIKSVTVYRKSELIEKLVALSETKENESASQDNFNAFDAGKQSSGASDQEASEHTGEQNEQLLSDPISEQETSGQKDETPQQETADCTPADEQSTDEEQIRDKELKRTDETQKTDEQRPAENSGFRSGYQRRPRPADPSRPQHRTLSGNYVSRTHTINRTPSVRDISSAPSTGGYVRNGGYAQSYNPVPDFPGSRTPRNNYASGYGRSQDAHTQDSYPRQEGYSRPQEGYSRPQEGYSRSQDTYTRPDYTRQQDTYARPQEAYSRSQSDSRCPAENTRTDFVPAREPDNDESLRSDTPVSSYPRDLASKEPAHGILELNPDGFGFLRSENYLTGDNDVYVSPAQIRKFNMRTGDVIDGIRRIKSGSEKFAALLYVNSINGMPPAEAQNRPSFEDLTPVFPNNRLRLETEKGPLSLRVLDLLSPIGKGQRGMIVSPPKAGKTTLLKDIAKAITTNYPDMRLIVLLIDERPEEVTDIKECIEGTNVEVIYSTFDEQPEHHKRVSEMVLERAKRLVEHKQNVMILLDSITRLARAYNLTVTPSGRTLSGGLDPAALHMPKKFFGAARCMREGGSLTILATALVETGSRMDDVVFEEFKGTGNMEVVLDRRLSERRIFPAIDICKSGTRRDDLLLSQSEQEAVSMIRKNTSSAHPEDSVEHVLDFFARTKNNNEFIEGLSKVKL